MVPHDSPGKSFLTKLLRRFIPVYGLWGFDGNLSPDYEGKKAIHLFAKRWVEKLRSPELTIYEFSDHFGEECSALGFQMDCGHQFDKLYPNALSMENGLLDTVISSITDVDVLGSAVFSQYRYLTHWAYYPELDEKTRHWFILALNQMCMLTQKK